MVIIDCTCPQILIMVLNYITNLHVFLQSHFEAKSTFVVGSILSTGFSYFSLAQALTSHAIEIIILTLLLYDTYPKRKKLTFM